MSARVIRDQADLDRLAGGEWVDVKVRTGPRDRPLVFTMRTRAVRWQLSMLRVPLYPALQAWVRPLPANIDDWTDAQRARRAEILACEAIDRELVESGDLPEPTP